MRFDTYTIDAALRELLHKHVKMKKNHTTNNKQTNAHTRTKGHKRRIKSAKQGWSDITRAYFDQLFH